jgi:hypothetical protein
MKGNEKGEVCSRQMHTKFRVEIPKERYHLEELGVDGRIILKIILNLRFGRVLTGVMWLRIEAAGGILTS